MEGLNSDTQWNDVLREKGILPQKDAVKDTFTEDEIVSLVEDAVQAKNDPLGKKLNDMTLDELDELEDDEDERVILEYRKKRIQEMKERSKLSKFGEVREITAVDYVDEVNKAGEGIWVVLHLYKQGIPLCSLINQFLQKLAQTFPATKFLKSISTTCVPNYPDRNLPTVFVYYEGSLKQQFVGPHEFGGMNLTSEALEWMLAKAGAMKTELESDPRHKVQDVLMASLKSNRTGDDSDDDDNDW